MGVCTPACIIQTHFGDGKIVGSTPRPQFEKETDLDSGNSFAFGPCIACVILKGFGQRGEARQWMYC
jgi:hypothetical protein